MGRDRRRQRTGRLIVQRAIQIAEHAESVLMRRLGNEPSDEPLIPHEHDLFLVTLERVKNGAEIPRDVGN
jgi:hypothetical protein